MRLTQAGIPNVVSLLGTTFSRLQLGWLAHAPMVLIMLDGDHAGWIAAHELASALDGSTGVKVHELPAGMEPEDLTDQELAEVSRRHLPFF
jgi:DNA primase